MENKPKDYFKIAVVLLLLFICFQLSEIKTGTQQTVDMVDALRVDTKNGFFDLASALDY